LMILMVLARTLAWIAEDLGPTWLRALANLTNALFGANEAFPNCAIQDFESSRVFPAGLISSAICRFLFCHSYCRAMPLGIHINQRILKCGQRKYKLLAPVPTSASAALMSVLLKRLAPQNPLQLRRSQ